MSHLSASQLAQAFVELADTLVDDFDVIEFLQTVSVQTSKVTGARAAGLLMVDANGRLQLVAASDERTHMLELFQVQSEEGPCQDCCRQGVAVVNADLAAARDRWPEFAPRAVRAGFRSVHAFPLRLRSTVYGALNLFGTEPGRMDADDVRVVQALADVATIGLVQQRALKRAEVLSEQLKVALDSRIVIEQAKGMLAQIHGCSIDDAFERLRSYARTHRLRLGDVAQTVVSSPGSLPGLTRRS